MKNLELYNKTVDILYQAYFNDTLEHGKCTACAVGNICAGSLGYIIHKSSFYWFGQDKNKPEIPHWQNVFVTKFGEQHIDGEHYRGEAKKQIDSTGYTWQELARIEEAFETASKGKSSEDYMFNGLAAVLKVLKDIHEVEDDSNTISKFSSHHQHKLQLA